MTNKNLKILLIEDDLIEIMKVERAISELFLKHQVSTANNGIEALKILKNETLELPDIILLDFHMPKMNGLEFLAILKSDYSLKGIPTIVLTTSKNISDIEDCYKMGIAGYVSKPLKYEDYVLKLKSIFEYWSLNELLKKEIQS